MDVDTDFAHTRGPEVFQHLIDKYGREYVSNVCTFTCMQMKQVIKDIGKVLDIPYEEINHFTKNIPDRDNQGNQISHISELKDLDDSTVQEFINKYPKLIKYAEKLEGTPRQISQHPAGIAVSPIPVTDLIPVTRGKPNAANIEPGYLSQFEKEQFEQSGLVKIDILKLNAVTQIAAMLQLIRKYYPQEAYRFKNNIILEENIPLDDPETYKLLCNLDVAGIFQMDNDKISVPVLKKVRPKNIDELAAITALIRPGSSGLDEYIAVKNGIKQQTKIDPRIDKILKPTYGAILFQETSMELISAILGISFGQADIYRRALEKQKKFPEKFKEFEDTIVERGLQNGFTEPVINYVKKLLIDNAGYGFNSAHAYAYSYITIYMAFIKANFPLAFYAAMIDDDISKLNIYIPEARAKNINILLPDISKSQEHTTIESVEDRSIRIGLNAIKGLGAAAFEPIIANQPYTSINDFLEKCSSRSVSKKIIEALINSDTFDHTPFIFKDDLKDTPLENHKPLYLDRKQLRTWYNAYHEVKSAKAGKNYLLQKDALPLNIQEDKELIFEKDNTIVVPQFFLIDFGIHASGKNNTLTEDDLKDLVITKKRPKGRLAIAKKKIPPIYQPFITNYDEIRNNEIDYIDAYIEDIKNNDFSLLEFPLPLLNLNGKESSIKGFIVGLIKSVKQCISKNNRIFYRIELVTRDKLITQLMGQTEYESFKDMIRPWRFIMYTGDEDQQYGGLHRRSGICNARKIVEIGAAILLKDQNRLTEQNEKSILQYMKSKNNILSSNELYNYLISDVIEQLNNPKKPKNPDFLK